LFYRGIGTWLVQNKKGRMVYTRREENFIQGGAGAQVGARPFLLSTQGARQRHKRKTRKWGPRVGSKGGGLPLGCREKKKRGTFSEQLKEKRQFCLHLYKNTYFFGKRSPFPLQGKDRGGWTARGRRRKEDTSDFILGWGQETSHSQNQVARFNLN